MFLLGTRWLVRLWHGRASLNEPHELPFALLNGMLSGMWFGLCTTTFTLFVRGNDYQWQVLASVVKVPLLLLVSLLASMVPLYIMSRLLGLGLRAIELWRLSGASVAIMGLALAPMGFLIALSCATKNYSIVVLGCYAAFSIAGIFGILYFLVVIRRSDYAPDGTAAKTSLLALIWAVCFGLIAAQVGWCIRPFVGWTGTPFSWFRHDDMHLYDQVYYEVGNLIRGGGARFPESTGPSTTPSPTSAQSHR